MELQFEKTACFCLTPALREVRTLEQAQEIRLSDGMPDIGRVLCGWGQVIQRSKEWAADCVSLTAGMMVWVLYAPEDGSEARWVEGWIPFSATWDLPQTAAEGTIRIQCLTRFVDARSLSARKIMVRAGVSALCEAWIPAEGEVFAPKDLPEAVELQKVTYPLRVPKEAGEKAFALEEELTLPGTAPGIEKPVYYTLEPEIQEQRVMGDKVVFRGSARLHLLYLTQSGGLHGEDFTLAFSQFAELREGRSSDAQVSLLPGVTALELEMGDSTHLHLKCGLTAQYLIDDLQTLEVCQDAYCLDRDLEISQDILDLGALLDSRQETLAAEQTLPGEGEAAVDVCFFPDFPRQRLTDSGVTQEVCGTFQVLYLAGDGSLQAGIARWEGRMDLAADPACRVTAEPVPSPVPQILMGGGDMKLRTEYGLRFRITAGQGIPMVTGLTLGEQKEPKEDRPSLILRRAGTGDLWQIAKASGSTVGAIRSANHLAEEPAPGQMLLIPIL